MQREFQAKIAWNVQLGRSGARQQVQGATPDQYAAPRRRTPPTEPFWSRLSTVLVQRCIFASRSYITKFITISVQLATLLLTNHVNSNASNTLARDTYEIRCASFCMDGQLNAATPAGRTISFSRHAHQIQLWLLHIEISQSIYTDIAIHDKRYVFCITNKKYFRHRYLRF